MSGTDSGAARSSHYASVESVPDTLGHAKRLGGQEAFLIRVVRVRDTKAQKRLQSTERKKRALAELGEGL